MKTYSLTDYPIKVFGIPYFEKTGILERLPASVRQSLWEKRMDFFGNRPTGARVCFRTNAEEFTLKMVFKTLKFDIALGLYCCQSAEIFVGKDRKSSKFLSLFGPLDYDTKIVEKTFKKKPDEEEVTIWLPRNEIVSDFTITIDDDKTINPPTPYDFPLPIIYYGSSITEGGNCCRITNAYPSIISQWLDVDFYNMGFAGSALGEPHLAEYFSDIPMSIFVLDYDYNAPNLEHLKNTHKPFFDIIRKKNPTLPIIIMSRPGYGISDGAEEAREVIMKTYESAVASGDKNVYFIDGKTLLGDKDRGMCINDKVHPNDLGFYRMAERIAPVIKSILEK
jgi:hypothetical protein